MRILFIIPELIIDPLRARAVGFIKRVPILRERLHRLPLVRDRFIHPFLYARQAWGGILNIMRHCALVKNLGVETALVTPRGLDTFGRFNIVDLPFLPWSAIRPDDLCVIPDFASDLADRLRGPVIVYLQAPNLVFNNFDYMSPRVKLWTDSPFMVGVSTAILPGKEIPIVPNIVDPKTFPFREQSKREPVVFAFPRKGADFIQTTRDLYSRMGGNYFRFELIDGLPLFDLAREMQRPQVFLASAESEGCALPPQESMACGVVVVGKTARGANFSMEHRRTAMVAETPETAAESLLELEDPALREYISRTGHAFISRYFPENEPAMHWRRMLASYGFTTR